MKPAYLLGIGLFAIVAGGCRNHPSDKRNTAADSQLIPNQLVESTDTSFQWNNGSLYFQGQPYSGTVLQRDSAEHLISRQSYYQGKEEGWTEWYYTSGKINARRYFHLGEKDSVHMGWWETGKPRFEYHFRNGQYEGWFKEWYASGKPLKEVYYENGQEKRGQGWRENGKLYMSFEVRNGRMYGQVNPNLCYSLQNEQGEFIRSVKE
jgi:hypothetical protein